MLRFSGYEDSVYAHECGQFTQVTEGFFNDQVLVHNGKRPSCLRVVDPNGSPPWRLRGSTHKLYVRFTRIPTRQVGSRMTAL